MCLLFYNYRLLWPPKVIKFEVRYVFHLPKVAGTYIGNTCYTVVINVIPVDRCCSTGRAGSTHPWKQDISMPYEAGVYITRTTL